MADVTLGTVRTYALIDATGTVKGRAKAEEQLKGLAATMQATAKQMKQVGQSMSIGLTLPILALGKASVDTAVQIDSLKRGLTAVMGSSQAAAREMVKLREVAKLPGLGLREAYEGSLNLQAAGFSADAARKNLMAFGNALATVGKGKAELDRVSLALTQLANRTSGFGQEVRQLQEALPQIRQTMMNVFGTADSELIGKMGITGRQFVDAIADEFARLPAVTGGARNALENFSDTLTDLKQSIGDAVLPMLTRAMEALEPKVKAVAEWFKQLSPAAKDFVSVLGVGLAAGGPVILGLSMMVNALGNVRNALVAIAALPAFKWLAARAGIALAGIGGATIAAPLAGAAVVGSLISAFNKPGSQFPGAAGRAGAMDKAQFGTPKDMTIEEQLARGEALAGVKSGSPYDILHPGNKIRATGPKFKLPPSAEETARLKAIAEERKRLLDELAVMEASQNSEFDGRRIKAEQKRQENLKTLTVAQAKRIYDLEITEIEKDRKQAQTRMIAERQSREKEIARKWADISKKNTAEQEDLSARAFKAVMSEAQVKRRELLDQFQKDKLVDEIEAQQVFDAGWKAINAQVMQAKKQELKRQNEEEIEFRKQMADDLAKLMGPVGGAVPFNAPGQPVQMPNRNVEPSGELKKRVAKSFDFGRELGSNFASEFSSEFARSFDKLFGKGNPITRAIGRTLERFLDDMLYTALSGAFGKSGGAGGTNMAAAGKPKLGGMLGGVIGTIFGGGIGGTIGGLLGGALGFDNAANDAKAFRWGRDFGSHFSRGAVESAGGFRPVAAGAGGGTTMNLSVNIPGMVVREEADIQRLSRSVALEVQRAQAVRQGSGRR